MAAKAKKQYKYVAHIQKDGKVTEVAGIREATNTKSVYQHLLQLASTLGGWLLTQQIVDEDAGKVESGCTYNEKGKPAETAGIPDNSAEFGAITHWSPFTSKYPGASRVTFKE